LARHPGYFFEIFSRINREFLAIKSIPFDLRVRVRIVNFLSNSAAKISNPDIFVKSYFFIIAEFLIHTVIGNKDKIQQTLHG
jgi:hypothetical protein